MHSLKGKTWIQREPEGWRGSRDGLLALGAGASSAELLARRGYGAERYVELFTRPMAELWPGEAGLAGLRDLLDRVVGAVVGGETVAVVGDYDVDGLCSTAIAVSALKALGCTAHAILPDRHADGYGFTMPVLGKVVRAGATLAFTVDCGTSSAEAIEAAKGRGIDVVVVDHHAVPRAGVPAAVAVVNPRRPDDSSGVGHPCAATLTLVVTGHLMARLRGREVARRFMRANVDLAALASVADVVPLTGLSRAMVVNGLKAMNGPEGRPALAALMGAAGAKGPMTAHHLGFVMGPRLNAPGRLGPADAGLDLLLERDPRSATAKALALDATNAERRSIEAQALAEAMAELEAYDPEHSPVIVVAGERWNAGVMGLVAARLRERYEVPAFAFAAEGAVLKGSGRSTPGVDIGAAVMAAAESGVAMRGGGHAMAAGATLDREGLEGFRRFMAERLGAAARESRSNAASEYDLEVGLGDMGASVGSLEALEPYGAGHAEPVMLVKNVSVASKRVVGDHMLLTVADASGTTLRANAWRSAGGALSGLKVGDAVSLVGRVRNEEYRGRTTLTMTVEDVGTGIRDTTASRPST